MGKIIIYYCEIILFGYIENSSVFFGWKFWYSECVKSSFKVKDREKWFIER